MKVTAPADVYLVALGDNVNEGDTVEVDDDVGLSLIEQGWSSPDAQDDSAPAFTTLEIVPEEPPEEQPYEPQEND
jgi:hypothetical protein